MEEELHVVYQQLEICRQQQQQQQLPHDDVTSQLELGMAPRSSNALALFNQTPQPQSYNINNNNTVAAPLSVSQQHSYSNSNSVDYNNSPLYMDSKDNATNPNLWIQCPYTSNNSNSITMQPHQLIASESQPLSSVQQGVVEDNYDEMHSFFDTVDDRQSYIYSKEAYESRYIDHLIMTSYNEKNN
jgi:hypothetical protein